MRQKVSDIKGKRLKDETESQRQGGIDTER